MKPDTNEINKLRQHYERLMYTAVLHATKQSFWALKDRHQLVRMSLNNNRLTQLPQDLGSLDELKELDVTNNRLQALPSDLGRLPELTVLIDGNALVFPPVCCPFVVPPLASIVWSACVRTLDCEACALQLCAASSHGGAESAARLVACVARVHLH